MGIYTIKILWELVENIRSGLNYNTYCLGEFLINYQGGFVRRGFLGEIIYQSAVSLNISPQLFVGIFCALCVAIVVWFFVVQFRHNNICWWLLPLNFCLANLSVIRKDYFFVVSLILILICYKSTWNRILKIILINIIAIITILSHEVFFFYCVPLLCWIIFREDTLSKNTACRILICIPIFLAMLIVSIYHGDGNTAQLIANSWTKTLNIDPTTLIPPTAYDGIIFDFSGAIGALSWDIEKVFFYHVKRNFLECSLGISGFVIRPIMLFIVFYFIINFLSTFSSLTYNRTVFFTRIYIFQFLSLLPLFTFLSCDTFRIYFYWFTSSFIFFFLLNDDTDIKIAPRWYQRMSDGIHFFFTEKLKAPIWLLIVLLLTLSVPFIGNSLVYSWENNVIMQVYRLFSVGIKAIM